MYWDSVIVASLITVAAVLAILGYLGYYGYRHLRQDEKAALKAESKSRSGPRAG